MLAFFLRKPNNEFILRSWLQSITSLEPVSGFVRTQCLAAETKSFEGRKYIWHKVHLLPEAHSHHLKNKTALVVSWFMAITEKMNEAEKCITQKYNCNEQWCLCRDFCNVTIGNILQNSKMIYYQNWPNTEVRTELVPNLIKLEILDQEKRLNIFFYLLLFFKLKCLCNAQSSEQITRW